MILSDKVNPLSFAGIQGQPQAVKMMTKWTKNLEDMPKNICLLGNTGRGKTTSLKILAATIVCTDHIIEKDGSKTPCGKCSECKNVFNEAWNPMKDVHYFSGRKSKVDLLLELEKKMMYSPMSSPYRVIILDELQDATGDFKKALLALLEKKGTRTKLILASMDPQSLENKSGKGNKNALLDRCKVVKFVKIKVDTLVDIMFDAIEDFVDPEGKIDFGDGWADVISRIAVSAEGSARSAINNMSSCIDAEAFTNELADDVLLEDSEEKIEETLTHLLNKSSKAFELMNSLDITKFYKLSKSKLVNALIFKAQDTLDDGTPYANFCKKVFIHKNYNELRNTYKEVHNQMASYWDDNLFKMILAEYVLGLNSVPVTKPVSAVVTNTISTNKTSEPAKSGGRRKPKVK